MFTTISDYRRIAPDLADALFEIRLLVGTGTVSSAPSFELERPLNRMEALTLVVRLMGLEARANAFSGTNPFSDTPEWGRHIAAFAYSEGITSGIGGREFAPHRLVTYQEFTAFLLRILGYSETHGDFLFDNTLNKATEVGLYSTHQMNIVSNSAQFLRADTTLSMVNALLTSSKDTNTRLIDVLVVSNVISRGEADRFIADVGRVIQF